MPRAPATRCSARAHRLIALGARREDVDRIDADARAEIAAAQRFAEESPPPDAKAAFTDVQTVGSHAWR